MDYTTKQINLIKCDLEPVRDHKLHARYDDTLDEIYPECRIAGMSCQTSRALKEADPVAYRCGFADWLDSEIGETLTDEIDSEYYDLSEVEKLIEDNQEKENEENEERENR